MKRLIAGFCIGVIGLSGCAEAPINSSGRNPEVAIRNSSKKQVVDAVTNMMLGRGYKIKSITDYKAVFGRPTDSTAAKIFFGSQYDVQPESRLSYDIVDSDQGIRVLASLEMVTNPGSAYERVTDMSRGADSATYQTLLNNLRDDLEKKSPPPPPARADSANPSRSPVP